LYKLEQLPPTPVDILKTAATIAEEEGLKYIYVGNVPGNEIADTKCPSCGTVVVSRIGYRIVSNTIKNGNCGTCGKKIEGVWS
jgi:pyruvate formate lyase activating enzyme